ncbi:MAG: KH domain-containing protein [Clostridia bacterium]|nr:KH domain-containing protein [Clostridia bacterium]
MLELVKYIVETFAEHKDAIEYKETENEAEGTVEITVYLDERDMGKVIGKQGKIAKAMRTLVRAAAPHDGKKYLVEIREKEAK